MFSRLFLLFALLPIIEIALLVNVGEVIGGWNTVAIVIFTAALGAYLVRQQGLATLLQAQQRLQQGQVPGQQMAEGLLLVVAGVLLVTPGFITDGIGFLLCLPVTRPFIAKKLLTNLVVRSQQHGHAHFHYSQTQSRQHDYSPSNTQTNNDIIEGEFTRQPAPGSDADKRLERD